MSIESDRASIVWLHELCRAAATPLSRLRIPYVSTLQNAIEQLEKPISAATGDTEIDEADASRWAATRSETVAQLKGFVADNKSCGRPY